MDSPDILCISLSPALDRYVTVRNFQPGKVNRTLSVDERAGGKNINAARALKQIGGNPLVISTLGGHSGDAIIEEAQSEGIELLSVQTASVTRQFTVIWDESGETLTQVSERWNEVTAHEWQQFCDLIREQITGDRKFSAAIISGRMPPNIDAKEVASVAQFIANSGIPCFVDSAGKSLEESLKAKPAVVKINHLEAGGFFKKEILTIEEALTACDAVISTGIQTCIITMGINGAVGASGSEAYHVNGRNRGLWPVGSGDAFLGGIAVSSAQGKSLKEILTIGTSAATANAHRQVAGLLCMEEYDRSMREIMCTKLN